MPTSLNLATSGATSSQLPLPLSFTWLYSPVQCKAVITVIWIDCDSTLFDCRRRITGRTASDRSRVLVVTIVTITSSAYNDYTRLRPGNFSATVCNFPATPLEARELHRRIISSVYKPWMWLNNWIAVTKMLTNALSSVVLCCLLFFSDDRQEQQSEARGQPMHAVFHVYARSYPHVNVSYSLHISENRSDTAQQCVQSRPNNVACALLIPRFSA